MELRNAKFLENDFISRSDQSQNIISEEDYLYTQPSTSSNRLIVIHTLQVQTGIAQPILKIPQVVDNNPVN